jgi:polysaccharide deacetylase 2 family uncharacterized protein YibQ
MSRQRYKGPFLKRAPFPAHLQAGRSATRLAVVLGVLSALILFAALYLLREQTRRPTSSLPPQPPGQAAAEKMQAADRLASGIISSLTLHDHRITLEQFPRREGDVTWNESLITVTLPSAITLHQVEQATGRALEMLKAEGLTADTAYDGDACLRVTVAADRRITHQLVFHLAAPSPAPPEEPRAAAAAPYRVALVIDDLGENYEAYKELESLQVPITYAILPFQTHSVKIADAIHATACGEIMLHLPLEPWNSEHQSINHGTLRTGMPREELLAQLEKNINAVPHLAGVSNHMGSKFTEDRGSMRLLLNALQEKDLYFLDSRTSKKTVGHGMAREMQLRTARRDLFLDSTHDQQFVEKQLQKILPLAQRRGGTLVVIGHPHQYTISALRNYLPVLKQQGVAVVPLSELVQ